MIVFDGHNDVLLRLWLKKDRDAVADFLNGDGEGHLDLPRMIEGGFAGGMFAVWVPNPLDPHGDEDDLNPPLAGEIAMPKALPPALAMAALLFRIERASAGRFKVCRNAADIRACLASGVIAAVLHLEGAECIDAKFKNLEVLYQSGLRSLGPVWSRPNIFGHGVPFRFPHSPDTGPGLTDTGKDLVRLCNELGILIDLSHLNEKGFWDVAKLSKAPLVATHSNAHAICASSRNLTDDQIRAIGDSGGMIGLNFANFFLRPDGRRNPDTGFDVMLKHLDHMMNLAGENHVGLGSDFDGCQVPTAIGDAAGLQGLIEAMRARGHSEALIARIAHGNWTSVLARSWGE